MQTVSRVRIQRTLMLLVAAGILALGFDAMSTGTTSEARSLSAAPFAHPAFERVWTRTDRLVSLGQGNRSWFWGPQANSDGLQETYANSATGTRLVQYFDKSRMEINNPNADPNNPFFVTNGLLTVELISGNMQTGDSLYLSRYPACINATGDADDANAPTYNSFRTVASVAPGLGQVEDNKVGQPATRTINRAGEVGTDASKASVQGVNYAYYEPVTRHNIPQAFWNFLNQQGPVIENGQTVTRRLIEPWFYASGYPVSDAFWTRAKIAGTTRDVLIQAYERRVLTYNPSNPLAFQVEMGNIGQHYYDWRYSNAGVCPGAEVTPTTAGATPTTGGPTATVPPGVTPPTATATAQAPTVTATRTTTPTPQAWNHPVELLSNRSAYYLRLTGPGQIRARATWTGTQTNLALIINGPGQVNAFARQDGGSPLEVVYNVTPANFAAGDTWRVTVASFGTGQANGSIEITYPSSGAGPVNIDFVVQPSSGSEVDVVVLRGPGPINAQATWTGTPNNLALIVNGPGQVNAFARQDGGSPLSVSYNVTPANYSAGSTWLVRLVSFAANTNANGQININYP